jgi:hypothetical protein
MTFPTYDDNWRMIRSLWPRWKPNTDEVALYANRFDKPHGVAGTNVCDQIRLRKAIARAKETQTWDGAPDFAILCKRYSEERSAWLFSLARTIPGAVTQERIVERQRQIQKQIEFAQARLLEAKPKQIEEASR